MSEDSLMQKRLMEERKTWRKCHPFGFFAKPAKDQNGNLDLTNWNAGIPGKDGTAWAGATYPMLITFPKDYPTKPPRCRFDAGFYHPNVYPSGTVCLSILNEEEDWRPSITLSEIVLGIQELMNNPNPHSPAQNDAFAAFQKNKQEYDKRVAEQVKKYAA
ncbi:SUMO-conjugating enzyme UBC9 [Yarrowia sp. C11]|nr:SUMO-conjugating enzyme UBC9 [Yarrowia sp. E02]KAG5372401.1 SUMO-conjugating enzyme UBC9 [Yarrowia sp. C11]